MKIPEIDFGRLLYNEYEGNNAYVMSIADVETDNYICYGEKLKEIGYDSYITIEREISGDKQIEDIKKAKAYLEELINA